MGIYMVWIHSYRYKFMISRNFCFGTFQYSHIRTCCLFDKMCNKDVVLESTQHMQSIIKYKKAQDEEKHIVDRESDWGAFFSSLGWTWSYHDSLFILEFNSDFRPLKNNIVAKVSTKDYGIASMRANGVTAPILILKNKPEGSELGEIYWMNDTSGFTYTQPVFLSDTTNSEACGCTKYSIVASDGYHRCAVCGEDDDGRQIEDICEDEQVTAMWEDKFKSL